MVRSMVEQIATLNLLEDSRMCPEGSYSSWKGHNREWKYEKQRVAESDHNLWFLITLHSVDEGGRRVGKEGVNVSLGKK